jgi:hypothetical protein
MYLGLNRRKYITYKLSDLIYLNLIMHIVLDQLERYNSAMSDVMTYAIVYNLQAVGSDLPQYNHAYRLRSTREVQQRHVRHHDLCYDGHVFGRIYRTPTDIQQERSLPPVV